MLPATANRHAAPARVTPERSKRRTSRSGRRYGSSSGSSAGTTAIPPAGSASIASAFARATSSTVPTSSRCSGPIEVTSATVGRATAQSSAIWPRPRMPISVTSTRVSGSRRSTVSGSPSSLFRLASAAIVGVTAPAERAERVLRRRLPRRADDGDDLRVRAAADEARERRERGLLVVRDERRRPARAGVVDEPRAGVERDEEVARPGVARVVVDAADHAVRRAARRAAEPQRLDLLPAERDHRVPRAPSSRL